MDSYKLFVVAFDFGSTYSGYAFSTHSNPNSLYTCEWKNNNLLSCKAPTSVLINKENEFVAFGFEADNRYTESLMKDDEDSDESEQETKRCLTNDEYRYFHRFKMQLHNQTINLKTLIKDQNGEEMKALDIFAFAIKYMTNVSTRKLISRLIYVDIRDIHYVLTVPAVWDDQAKVFMRKAAEQAGIKENQLTIVFEQEAASLYCQELRTNREDKTDKTVCEEIKKGKKHMVVDLGGRTADITVLERQPDGLLKVVIPTCGGAWGGTAIDDAFMRFLENVFSAQVVMKLKSKDSFDYMLLIHEFEVKKRLIKTEKSSDIVITLPISLVELTRKHCGGINAAIKRSRYGDSVSLIGTQKLSINPQTFRELFKTTIDDLLEYLDQLFRHPKISDVQSIIMVGGFSECELVQKAIKDTFPKKEINIPEEAGLAVLRGAVLYGHQPHKARSSLYREVIETPKLFVVAIDFGTTYSGYAFSAKSTPNNIYMCSWQDSTLVSSKAPTSVLLDKENKFVAFGYKAEAKYIECLETIDLDSDDEDTGLKDVFHYFNRFKMVLHKQKMNSNTMIKDQNGVQVRALDIFFICNKIPKRARNRHIVQVTN